jgi:hypothetical protein
MYLYIYFLSKNMIFFFIFEELVHMQLKYLEKKNFNFLFVQSQNENK